MLMAKQPTKQQIHSWAVYHIAARQKFVGIVYDQPDADAAIKQAIVEYNVPPNERGRLTARRGLMGTHINERPQRAIQKDCEGQSGSRS
jgi:hypothetical protein